MFERSLALLKENFLPHNRADVIVFHEADFDPSVLDGRTSGIAIRFAEVDFSGVPEALAGVEPAKRGYRHMCHFFANDIFFHPALEGYDYYMRLDDDSFILSPVAFDVFEDMAKGGFRYGYRAVIKDKPACCTGLWNTAGEYFKKNGCARDFSTIDELGMYYTNFEICDIAWFRSGEWQSFFAAIEAAEGIWRHRWGDAPIRYLGVKGLLTDDRIRHFREFHYKHQSEWRAGRTHRLPWDLIRYYFWVLRQIL